MARSSFNEVEFEPTFLRNVTMDRLASVLPLGGKILAAVDPDKAIRIARFWAYPKQVLYLVASFIALVSLSHFLFLAYSYANRNRVYSATKSRTSIRLSRLPLALNDSLRALAFRWTIPLGSSFQLNLAEMFMTCAYMAVLFTWTFVNTTTTTGIRVEPHYYANRAATIAASQLPIMTALGMRNNLISWLTGISFDKLSYLHRMSARVICILVWIHAGGRVTVGLLDDEAIVNRWVQCGVLAATTLTLLCILTLRPVRERGYELFLLVHFIFVFMFLLAVYFHFTGRNIVYYGAWPSMIVWGIDRLIRLVQLVIYNFAYFNPFSSPSQSASLNASVELLSSHFLRVTLYRPKSFHWRPGQSTYLSFPGISSFPFKLESHPFTIATIEDQFNLAQRKLTFFLRVRDGFTEKLKNAASSDDTFKVYLNGPCSSPPMLMGYQTIILIAGGSGVAFTLPLLLDIVARAKREENPCQKVIFIWAIRHPDHIRWIEDIALPALEDVPSNITIQLRFFSTGTLENPQVWDNESVEKFEALESPIESKEGSSGPSSQASPKLIELPFATVEQGRPDINKLIQDEIDIATGPISVNVCGTDKLASSVREAIRVPRPLAILRGGSSVTLHVEAFGGS